MSWPISAAETDIMEQVKQSGGVQPVLSSLWVYRCCREGKLVDRSGYKIVPNSIPNIALTSSPSSADERPVTPASASLPPGPALVQRPPALHLNQDGRTSLTPQATPNRSQCITPGRQTNNSLASTFDGNNESQSQAVPISTPAHPKGTVASKEQAISILADELYQFVHKRSQVTQNDISVFLKQLGTKRRERDWPKFYQRNCRTVDDMLRGRGLDTEGWHNHSAQKVISPPATDTHGAEGAGARKKRSNMKGWVWITE